MSTTPSAELVSSTGTAAEADRGATVFAFAAAILLGASLLFLVQPIVGKIILPWFGGSSGVWIVCLMFFQLFLLAGYLYAHCLVRFLTLRRQVLVHGCLLALSLPFRSTC